MKCFPCLLRTTLFYSSYDVSGVSPGRQVRLRQTLMTLLLRKIFVNFWIDFHSRLIRQEHILRRMEVPYSAILIVIANSARDFSLDGMQTISEILAIQMTILLRYSQHSLCPGNKFR